MDMIDLHRSHENGNLHLRAYHWEDRETFCEGWRCLGCWKSDCCYDAGLIWDFRSS